MAWPPFVSFVCFVGKPALPVRRPPWLEELTSAAFRRQLRVMLRPSLRWLPVVLWMGFIFMMSTSLGAGDNTSRFIEPFLHWLLPQADPATIAHLHFLIRKAGHLTEYAILALLLLRAIGGRGIRPLVWALVIATAYAATDEFHQSFVPGRTATGSDVLIDAFGALTALALAAGWRKRRGERGAN
ncbi:MAG: VanZ family protein [Opitutus sp.]